MEKEKIVSSAECRKPYEAPSAEVILLAPQEPLSAWDYGYHSGEDHSWRWALGQWNIYGSDSASGVVGTVNPEDWVPPVE